jgi:hypothetical protein
MLRHELLRNKPEDLFLAERRQRTEGGGERERERQRRR